MYEMTLGEMDISLTNRKKGLAYRLWKEGNLNQWLEKYPESPQDASPELYPPKPTIKKPRCLENAKLKRMANGEVIYEQ